MTIYLNTPQSVFKAIEDIAATSSKNEKLAILKAASTPLLMRVLIATYDPFKVFGIGKQQVPAKTPGLAPGGNTLAEDYAWNILDRLADKTLTGNAARDAVQQAVDMLDAPSSELFRRILMKDMRAGFTESSINKVWPKTIATFPYMRCSLPDDSAMPKWDWSQGIIVQEKADGMFTNVNRKNGQVWLTTRQGSVIPNEGLPALVKDIEISIADNTQTHGELTVFRDGVLLPREEGNGILNHILSGGTLADGLAVRFDAWDQIPIDMVVPKAKYQVPYKQRLGGIIKHVQAAGRWTSVRVISTKVVRTKAEAWERYRELLKQGREGVVCKHPDMPWIDGASKEQVKLKLAVPVELEVVGFNEGTGKFVGTLGSMVCETSCGKLRVNVNGSTQAMRDEVWGQREETLGKVVTVKANSIMAPETGSGEKFSLFLPVFVELRTDKSEANSLEEVRAEFRNATGVEE